LLSKRKLFKVSKRSGGAGMASYLYRQPEVSFFYHDDSPFSSAIVRLRPLNSKESKDRRIWKLLHEDSAIALTKPTGEPLDKYVDSQNYFTIDKPFGEDATTRDVYDGCVLGIVTSVCAGLNGTIFAYGQTSSGKTFTMQGSGTIQQGSESEHASGIIHMAAQDIFKHIDSRPDRLFMVRASFLEVYNEEVRDLLSDVSSKLKVQESNGVVTTECKEVPVSDWKSLLEILAQGEQSRTFASTAMNERSSRSHTIFRVTLESRSKGEEEEHDGTSLISTLNLVDLAGSESVRHTGATGERQVEGAKINKR
jgi:centromeric protein E